MIEVTCVSAARAVQRGMPNKIGMKVKIEAGQNGVFLGSGFEPRNRSSKTEAGADASAYIVISIDRIGPTRVREEVPSAS